MEISAEPDISALSSILSMPPLESCKHTTSDAHDLHIDSILHSRNHDNSDALHELGGSTKEYFDTYWMADKCSGHLT